MNESSRWLRIDSDTQRLTLMQGEEALSDWSVSTALNGVGEKKDSGCTPRGQHYVRAMIGADAVSGAVFVGRRPTGEVYEPSLAERFPDRDWILTRILWLSGLEPGRNRLGDVDTFQRYIYIHGTPDSEPMGKPLSHGCIRMRNDDICSLYEQCFFKMRVVIC